MVISLAPEHYEKKYVNSIDAAKLAAFEPRKVQKNINGHIKQWVNKSDFKICFLATLIHIDIWADLQCPQTLSYYNN